MWGEIIEGECNGYNYYDSDSEHAVDGWDDDSCICPSEHSKPKKKLQTWKCKDGATMLISEMTDKHLENSIAYCSRNRMGKSLDALLIEQKRRKKEKLYRELNQSLEANNTCQFCGNTLKIKSFEVESKPDDGGWWYYTDYRLVCKCGAMGPVIQTEGFKP